MVEAYGQHAAKFHSTGLGAYLDRRFDVSDGERDFNSGRSNFIYVGGTGGNLQKGLDLLIEAFALLPNLHLYIYCKVEEEILQYCRMELGLPNIHYIYHWRFRPFHARLKRLLRNTNFTVHAPINSGMGTAFMATMGAGLIPVGYVDVPDPGEDSVLTDSWQVEDLAECIRSASNRTAAWCREASRLARQKYAQHCDPQQVERNFRAMFESVKTDVPRTEGS
jgi:glycosyltransferase involved in cell wall biosynthesis